MGFRGDVVFAFYPKDDAKLPAIKLWVDENWPKDNGEPDIETKNGMVVVRYTDMWYGEYDYMKTAWAATHRFDETFNTEDYENHLASWDYVRIGEELDDIEQGGSSFRQYRVGVERSIVID